MKGARQAVSSNVQSTAEQELGPALDASRGAPSALDALQAALGLDDETSDAAREAIGAARTRATALAAVAGEAAEAERLAGIAFAAELLAVFWLDRRWSAKDIGKFVDRVAGALELGVDTVRTSVYIRAIGERHLLELPPGLGARAVLEMLATFVPIRSASLWTTGDAGKVSSAIEAGEADGSRTRAAARAAIATNERVGGPRSLVHALPVRRWGEAAGALVFRCRPDEARLALPYAAEAAAILGPIVEFEALLDRNAARERSLVQSSERLLTRLGFDLHDGPLQDIAALASELRLFRSQLPPILADSDKAPLALGRIDDLEARLVSVDRELRELAQSLQSPAALRTSLSEAIGHEVEALRQKVGIEVGLRSTGDFQALTSSQKIALLRVVQEALSNIQEHSGATSVGVRVAATRTNLTVEVTDNGQGFNVEQRLVQAAKAGRLGLVGMAERVRLLGGRLDLESKPGGPTRVRATVPRWQPLGERAGSNE